MKLDIETKNSIENIKRAGFTHVKYYDADLESVYYDAKMNGEKVEVKVKNDCLEWRYLGTSIEDITWFSLQTSNSEERQPSLDIEQLFVEPEEDDINSKQMALRI